MRKSGTEALRVYKSQRPDIVVTDWMMPDLSGIELCRAIRRDETEPYTYLILMTGNADHASVVEGLKAGADDYLTKPFDSGEMLARIGVGQRIIDLNRELAEQNARMTQAAETDALTGLPNRRAIEAWTSRQLFGATRYGFSVWVILMILIHLRRSTIRSDMMLGTWSLKRSRTFYGKILAARTFLDDSEGMSSFR